MRVSQSCIGHNYEKKEADKIEMAIKKREQDITTRESLLRMKDDKDDFVADLLTSLVCVFLILLI